MERDSGFLHVGLACWLLGHHLNDEELFTKRFVAISEKFIAMKALAILVPL
jgi:hypothetical protein